MTDKPATPLDNAAAIAQMGQELRDSMQLMLAEFLRPTMQQTQENAQALSGLIEVVADGEAARAEQDQRIENLLSEAREDRRRSDERFQAMQENIQRLFLEVRSTNVAVSELNNRVDELEREVS